MIRRLALGLIHALATTLFTFLEVTGLPRVKGEGRGGEDS